MAGFTFSGAEDVKNYKELIFPACGYELEIIDGKVGTTSQGVPYISFKFRIIDTYPDSGIDFDLDEFRDPYQGILQKTVFFQSASGAESWKNRQLKEFHEAFDVELVEDVELENYIGAVGGGAVKHVAVDKDNPGSALKAELRGWFPLNPES